jgi:hypothetical protein
MSWRQMLDDIFYRQTQFREREEDANTEKVPLILNLEKRGLSIPQAILWLVLCPVTG